MAATQKAKVLAYCKEHGSITAREAFNLDINSPRKVISDIRKEGYDVTHIDEIRYRADGTMTTFRRYYIGGESNA